MERLRIATTPEGVTLRVRVSAGASRDAILGVHGDALKVAVRQPPERGRANREVERLIAGAVGLKPASVSVVRGASARDKVVLLRGANERTVRANLVPFCSP